MNHPDEAGRELVIRQESWERIEGESARAFHSFSLFRDLGPRRSHSQVAEILIEHAPERKLDTVVSQLKKWSVQHGWVRRAESYDEYLDRRRRAEAETEMDERNRRYRRSVGAIAATIEQRLCASTPEGVKPLDANDLDLGQLVRALERCLLIEDRCTSHPGRSLAHVNCVSHADFARLVREMFEGMLSFIPTERHSQAAAWVEGLYTRR